MRNKIIAGLIAALLFTSYFAWNCWQDEKTAKKEQERINAEFKEYKSNNNAVKQLELNIIEVLNNANKNTDDLRNNVDNGFVELLVKVESIERDSTATGNVANQALRLAKSARQDYYSFINGISYNKAMIDGWQKYYCLEIAPKNNTVFLCEDVKWQ